MFGWGLGGRVLDILKLRLTQPSLVELGLGLSLAMAVFQFLSLVLKIMISLSSTPFWVLKNILGLKMGHCLSNIWEGNFEYLFI
jgi:hypothetical protein